MTDGKPRLIILSDLWGKENLSWTNTYVRLLEKYFCIQFYDCCELGDVSISDSNEDRLHHAFVNGGIDTAVDALLSMEKNETHVLGFSVGGLIGWKATLFGLKTLSLSAASSTRLRLETEKPDTVISLFYGKEDLYKPSKEWFLRMNLPEQYFKSNGHDFYQNIDSARIISNQVCRNIL